MWDCDIYKQIGMIPNHLEPPFLSSQNYVIGQLQKKL
jgi:hypothetical protein